MIAPRRHGRLLLLSFSSSLAHHLVDLQHAYTAAVCISIYSIALHLEAQVIC
jgi:hypothetical protein